jgi:transcriptional regulator with XRE-family HTH domain
MQKEVAKELKIAPSQYHRCEKGVARFSLYNMQRLSSILDYDFTKLLKS